MRNMYAFIPIEDLIQQHDINENILIDVIGKVVGPASKKMVSVQNVPTKMMEFNLEDFNANKIKVTIWKQNWMDVIQEIVDRTSGESDVIIVQMFKPRVFGKTVSISSTFHASQLVHSQDIFEIIEYKKRFEPSALATSSRKTKSITTLSSFEDDLQSGVNNVTTIKDLQNNPVVGNDWLYGKIMDIDMSEGWWYISCKKCIKGLAKRDDRFYCFLCHQSYVFGLIRYKLKVLVVDDTSREFFVLWDNTCKELFKKTASDILDNQPEDFDPLDLEEFKDLFGKKMMFKIAVKLPKVDDKVSKKGETKPQLTVVKICTDEGIISKYANKIQTQVDSTCDEEHSLLKVKYGFIDCEVVEELSTKRILFDQEPSLSASSKHRSNIKIKLKKD